MSVCCKFTIKLIYGWTLLYLAIIFSCASPQKNSRPISISRLLNLAMEAEKKGDLSKSRIYYRQIIKREINFHALRQEVKICLQIGCSSELEQELRKKTASSRASSTIHYQLAILLFAQSKIKVSHKPNHTNSTDLPVPKKSLYLQARKQMLTAIKNQPGKGEYYFRLGLIELETDNPQSALDNFNRAIKLDPKKPSYSLLRAAALFKLTNLTDGLDEISRFLTLEPSSKQIKNGQLIISGLMGLFCGTKGKIDPIMKKAIEYLEKADQPLATIDILDSIETTSPHMPMLHTIRGLAKFKLSNLSGAIQEFEQGKVNYPLCPDNYLYLGFVYTSLQKPEKARLYLKETLRLDPFNQKAYQWLAKIEIKARRFMLARKWLKILTVLEPDVISHHHRLGQVLLETGESHLAESIFLDIIEKDKKHSGALIQLGQLFLEKRKKAANQKEKDDLAQKAQEYLHQALSINPENEPVKKMLHDLKKH